ncbi:hypothetical protein SDC9_196006 [bioreactor metagenome]|uniref:Uncharacterized protein n=1 Tax=bioreactor metagenome TaxID=1076179 RepID=A0A645ID66_9ZZZZ|nr:hypothetical protein [Candidatus Pelethousia sp.]
MMTLLNINNTDQFFSIVDDCIGPVTVQSSDGQSKEDLRHNALLKDLLTGSGNGKIAKLRLGLENPKDASRMFQYMMDGD